MGQSKISSIHSPAVWLPDRVEEAWKVKQEYGAKTCFIAGGTLLQTQWQKGRCCPSNLISLEQITEMQGIRNDPSFMEIGTLTKISMCRQDPDILTSFPLLAEAARNIAAPAIRNRATVGGNIAGGSGDMIPALLALDAEVKLYEGRNRQSKRLWDYLKEKGAGTERLLINFSIPKSLKGMKTVSFYQKISRREAFAPSVITVSGVCCVTREDGITDVRLAAGGADVVPQRLTDSEQAVIDTLKNGREWRQVHQLITEEFQTNSDDIVSADYKRLAAANVIVSKLAGLNVKG